MDSSAYNTFTAVIFSTISSLVYFPTIATSFSVSVEQVNKIITPHLIVSGFAPSIFGDMASDIGRRPVLLTTFCLYAIIIFYSSDSDGIHTVITGCRRNAGP